MILSDVCCCSGFSLREGWIFISHSLSYKQSYDWYFQTGRDINDSLLEMNRGISLFWLVHINNCFAIA